MNRMLSLIMGILISGISFAKHNCYITLQNLKDHSILARQQLLFDGKSVSTVLNYSPSYLIRITQKSMCAYSIQGFACGATPSENEEGLATFTLGTHVIEIYCKLKP